MISATHTQTTPVTPAKAGARLFLATLASARSVAEGSLTPDQVRGDDEGRAAE